MSQSSKKGIPIPSFSFKAESNSAEDTEIVEESVTVPIQHEEEERKMIPLKDDWIIHLETALQIHFNHAKSSRISYKDFCKLVPKVVSNLPSSTSLSKSSGETTTPGEDESLLDLSTEQRLFHDLYCVGVPILYKLVRTESSVGLETVSISGNRFQGLRKLLEEAKSLGVLRKKSDEAKELLATLVEAAEKKTTASSTEKNNMVQAANNILKESSSLLVLKPDMNLEERVRARAALREKHLQDVEAKRKGPNTEERTALADALFSHACHTVRRRKRMQASHVHASTKCVSTFRDVLASLPNFSSQEITKHLNGIAETCPGWITWVDPKSGKNGGSISKDATVVIETHGYKRIRAKLNGEKLNNLSNSVGQRRAAQMTPENSRPRAPVVTVSGKKRGNRFDVAPAPSKSLKSLEASR